MIATRRQHEIAAWRRMGAAWVQAQIWGPFREGYSSEKILAVWADVLQRQFDAREVQIWTFDEAPNVPVLQARAGQEATAGDPVASLDLLKEEIRHVGASRTPLLVADLSRESQLAARFALFREQEVRGIVLHPVLSNDQLIGVLAVFFPAGCEAVEASVVETAAGEMGIVFARLCAEEDLRLAKRAYDTLLRTAPVAVCRLDASGLMALWSPAAERLFGYNAAEVLGHGLPIVGDGERELFDTCVGGALAGQGTVRLETKGRTQGGRLLDIVVSLSPLVGSDGAVDGALVVIGDLSDRKRAERRLNLQQTVTKILCGAQAFDEAIAAALAAIATQLGWDCGEFWRAEEPSGVLKRTVSWQSRAPHAREFDDENRNGTACRAAELAGLVQSDGKPRRFEGFSSDRGIERAQLERRCGFDDAFGFPIVAGRNAAGVMLFFAGEIDEPDDPFLALITAISEQIGQFFERCRTEDALREAAGNLLQAQKMDTIGRLVGGVVHDFNNLLTIILGYGEIVLEQIGEGSTRDLFGEVVGAAKRAAGLTRQLLAFCRKEVSEPVALDLNAHLAEMEKMFRRLIGESIELQTILCPNLGHVTADPAQIEQVVMNLVVNARDAMPHGGRLAIETKSVDLDAIRAKSFPRALPGRYALLSVSDTGCGMDEATKSRIFEPFFTTKPAGKGTGMGLSTVSEIVEQNAGQIAVESQPNKGTTFHLLFPAVAKGLSPWQVDAAPVAIPRGDETVLVVEDDARVLRLMSHILQAQGYTVLEAGDPNLALDLFAKRAAAIDLLIADVVLPNMNGPELARRITVLKSDVKVLFVSGYGDGEIRPPGALGPGAAYLQKPFTTYDLARKVRDVCES